MGRGEASPANGSGGERVWKHANGCVGQVASRGEASPATISGGEPASIRGYGYVDQAASWDASPLRSMLQEDANG